MIPAIPCIILVNPAFPGSEPVISPVRRAMMQVAEKKPAKYSQANCLPVGDDAKVENDRHQPVPEPHNNCPEKECKTCKSNNSEYYPSKVAFSSTAEVPSFIFVFCCLHVFYF